MTLLSHELRAPLAVVKEGVNLVLDRIAGPINSRQRQILRLSRKNVDRLDRVIMNMLDLSKIEAGRMELRFSRVDLIRLARHAVQVLDEEIRAKQLQVRVSAAAEKVEIEADKDRIGQVLAQVLGNAIKFTPEKGSVEVRIEARPDGGARVSVEDTGVGIAPADLAKVFKKFQQFGWAPGGGEKGVGLGLAVAKGIIDLHGGTAAVSSRPGEGSRFQITLPGAGKGPWPKKRS